MKALRNGRICDVCASRTHSSNCSVTGAAAAVQSCRDSPAGNTRALSRARTRAAKPVWLLQLAEEKCGERHHSLQPQKTFQHFLPAAMQQSQK